MEELLEILREVKDTIDYENETALIDDELIDSLDLMQLISELEEAYDIEIGMEYIVPENFNSASAILNLINELQND